MIKKPLSIDGLKPLIVPKTIRSVMQSLQVCAETRIVGGSVRDHVICQFLTTAIANSQITDTNRSTLSTASNWQEELLLKKILNKKKSADDLAIATEPKKLLDYCRQFQHWHLILNGFNHGVVRIISHGKMLEVACLRLDIKTDGRHAKVVYGANWQQDAKRRDFTINSLNADSSGKIYDEIHALPDFSPLQLKFIGNAETRIKEDYLRILRYYRFLATLPYIKTNNKERALLKQYACKLKQLSAERIGSELIKILQSPKAVQTLIKMTKDGIWQGLGFAPNPRLLQKLVKGLNGELPKFLATHFNETAHACFYCLLLQKDNKTIFSYQNYALPKLANKLIAKLQRFLSANVSLFAVRHWAGDNAYQIIACWRYLQGEIDTPSLISAVKLEIAMPNFPLNAKELRQNGFTEDDFVRYWKKLKNYWLESNGMAKKSELLTLLNKWQKS